MSESTRFSRFLQHLSETTRWRRNGFLFAVGLLCAAAFPPIGIMPVLVFGLAFLLIMLQAAPTQRRAFADGWWFTYGMHVSGMYWIAISMMVDLAKFGWMIPFSVFGLSGFFALYGGLAAWITWRLPRLTRGQRVITFALAWTSMEILRGWLFSGFPWNIAGNAWSQWDIALQPASLVGAYGMSLWTVLAAGVLAWPCLKRDAVRSPIVRRRWIGLCGCVVMLVVPLIYGGVRLSTAPDYTSPLLQVPGVQLRLVEPAIAQSLKWDPNFANESIQTLLQLSKLENKPQPTHIIWPEAAVPFLLEETPALVRDIAAAAPKKGWILSGGDRVTRDGEGRPIDIYNGMQLIEANGALRSLYDKISLVPFGEFVPLRNVLPLSKITPGSRDFSVGKVRGPIGLPDLPPAAPLICYEIVFPGHVRNQMRPMNNPEAANQSRAQWILNITNDAWFGTSSGPYQHFGMARMRAAELGLPLVRVANTGITAVVDPYGRVLDALPLNARGVLDSPLPKALDELTPFARLGHVPLVMMMGLLLMIAGLGCLRWRR